jgi:Ca2+-binding RTX toxin-like protein
MARRGIRRYSAFLIVALGSLALPFVRPATSSAQETCFGLATTVAGPTSGDDVLTGTSGDDVIVGMGGNDTIEGLGGYDFICGGDGNDTMSGGGNNDRLAGGLGDDRYDGGPGVDLAAFTAASRVFASLATGEAVFEGSDSLIRIESLSGTSGADMLDGDEHANALFGGPGGDQLRGFGSDSVTADQLVGNRGADTLVASAGPDHLNGGPGPDRAVFSNAPNGVSVDLATGVATGYGSDTLVLIENLVGSQYADTLEGDANPNDIDGLGGDDTLRGREGDDRLNGADGTDTIYGGDGYDYCVYGEKDFSCETPV